MYDAEDEEKDEQFSKKEFHEDMREMHKQLNNNITHVQKQTKKMTEINDTLDNYDAQCDKSKKYLNVVNHGPWGSIKGFFSDLFSSDSSKKKKTSKEDKKIINEIKNKEINNNVNKNIENKNEYIVINKNGEMESVEKDVDVDDLLKEIQEMRKDAATFKQEIKKSDQMVDILNDHMDRSLGNTNKLNKRMKK